MTINQSIRILEIEVGDLLKAISSDTEYVIHNGLSFGHRYVETNKDRLDQIGIKKAKILEYRKAEENALAEAAAARQAIKEENADLLRELMLKEMSKLSESAQAAVSHGEEFSFLEKVDLFVQVLGASQLRSMLAALKRGKDKAIRQEIEKSK